jgi:Ca2+-binding EF-hand superfamily protein
MGNKGVKASQKPSGKKEFTERDYDFLGKQSGLERAEIKEIFEQFNKNNPDQLLDKKEFVKLFHQFSPQTPELLGKISEYVFRAFDTDHNGIIKSNIKK